MEFPEKYPRILLRTMLLIGNFLLILWWQENPKVTTTFPADLHTDIVCKQLYILTYLNCLRNPWKILQVFPRVFRDFLADYLNYFFIFFCMKFVRLLASHFLWLKKLNVDHVLKFWFCLILIFIYQPCKFFTLDWVF